jgi:hypothetical protein
MPSALNPRPPFTVLWRRTWSMQAFTPVGRRTSTFAGLAESLLMALLGIGRAQATPTGRKGRLRNGT